MTTHEASIAQQLLPPPLLEPAENAVLEPSERRAVVRVSPYPGMASGDKLQLHWQGLDVEGLFYRHQVTRFVSEEQVGLDTVFVVPATHIAALDGGSLEVFYTLQTVLRAVPAHSARLQLSVGDVSPDLLPAIAADAVGGTIDPDRVPEGTLVTIRPYARMAEGDQILLAWAGVSSQASFDDTLKVEAFAVGNELSFWINPACIAPNLGSSVTLSYCVQQAGQAPRYSELVQLLIGPLSREPLLPPLILEADEGSLDLQDAMDGITVVIDGAGAEEGELVYLKCDGDYFNHRDDREITREMAGEPLVFVVPYRFWREHRDTTIRVAYTVERLDDVSQESEEVLVQVHS
ncbi:hypothetical protein M5G20_05400 [Pseudomonas sp. TNT2022 ID1044]|uniref:hypothetical protein n=1 Tax=Pseudomonas sp. TNT2022 ID1044 TaxID=2942636 RepID=UPI00235E2B87|nr:hypothetical protein [Pseudomonas sp. TNT2022 ID1044]MDD0995306.1 hypothetical protein [Pseudomonas sp. TNT2022 ID1044]